MNISLLCKFLHHYFLLFLSFFYFCHVLKFFCHSHTCNQRSVACRAFGRGDTKTRTDNKLSNSRKTFCEHIFHTTNLKVCYRQVFVLHLFFSKFISSSSIIYILLKITSRKIINCIIQ